MARARTRSWRLSVALVAVAIAIALAGCATAPSSGEPTPALGGTSQVQAYPLALPPPAPTSRWEPWQVVTAFLHASATFDIDQAAARQYLTKSARKSWHPAAVTIVGAPAASAFKTELVVPEVKTGQHLEQQESVTFTGSRVATLSESGQYQSSSGSAVFSFQLARVNGVWLIDSLNPANAWLMLQPDFAQVYRPRNLFFWTPPGLLPGNGVLVPDPVFAPIQVSDSALNTSLATGLVSGLINQPSSWLSGATWTAFPRGTVIKRVSISGQTALVDLGGAAARKATKPKLGQMADQLLATLSDKSYSGQSLATSVKLEINGHSAWTGRITNNYVPQVGNAGTGAQPYFVRTGASTIAEVTSGNAVHQRLGQAQLGLGPVTALAATTSSSGQVIYAVATQASGGCAVYLPEPATTGESYSSYQLTKSGGPCTSLSWDGNFDVFAVAGGRIFDLPASTRRPIAVTGPVMPGSGQKGLKVLALRMAPDGVRAAVLVSASSSAGSAGSSAGNRLLLAAVRFQPGGGGRPASVSLGPAVNVGTGLVDPTAMSWYDPYHLMVLASNEIYDVPLIGGPGQELGSPPEGAVSLSTDGTGLVVGTVSDQSPQYQVWTSSVQALSWKRAVLGSDPIYGE